jgi:iron complex outermembrane recepter protein
MQICLVRTSLICACTFVISFIVSPAVHADAPADTPTVATDGTSELSEVVVTAQRREELNSKVPVAITAFSSEMLENHTVTNETDLRSVVSGLTVKAGESTNELNYSLRGQTLDWFSGSSPGVLPYVNDVAMAATTESSTAFYDLASVQVLKGPQGTLFGRNVTGGAVLYNTAAPNDNFDGYGTLKFGNYNLREFQGAANVPVVPGKLDVRVAVDSLTNTGYVTNQQDGIHLGDNNFKSGRLSIKAMPLDGLVNTTVLQYNSDSGTNLNPLVYSVYSPGQTSGGSPLNTTAYLLSGGEIVPYLARQQQAGYTNANLLFTPHVDSHGVLLQNTTVYDVSTELQAKNIFGYSDSIATTAVSLGGAPFLILDVRDALPPRGGARYDQINWSEEFQLLGHTSDQVWKYIVGLYASGQPETFNEPLQFGPATFFHYNYRTTDNSKAIFGQGTYDLSQLSKISGLSLTAGIRYTWESLGNQQKPETLFPGAADQNFDESNPSWQLGLQYQVTAEELLYVVTRGSWRAGGFTNANPATNLNAFKAEKTHDVEIGSKFAGQFLGKPTHLDLALYDQITTDVQRDFYVNINGLVTGITANVPRSEAKGVELDAEMRPLPWLTLGLSGAYTFAKFTEPTATVLGQSLTFSQYEDTPRWTGTLSASVMAPIPESAGELTLRADGYVTTNQFFSSLALPGTQIPGYALLNLRADWKNIMRSPTSVGIYVKNALNRHYLASGFPLGDTTGENLAIPGIPLTAGVELNYKF